MKYGVNTLLWTTRITEAHEALFDHIRDWGFDGVELFVSPEEPSNVAAMRRMLERTGLEGAACTVLPRDCNLVSSDAQVRAKGAAYLKECIGRTAEFGGNLICGPLYAALGVMTGARRTREEWQRAVEGIVEAAAHARSLGVTLCLEPLNRFETYFLNTLEDASRLVHDVDAANVRVHFDTFHANIEEKDLAASLRRTANVIGHVHLSENDRGIPGTGHVDWRGVFSALKDTGYDGWLTIESFAQPEPELAAAAAIWRDLAPSGDDLAIQGLKFAKSLSRELDLQ